MVNRVARDPCTAQVVMCPCHLSLWRHDDTTCLHPSAYMNVVVDVLCRRSGCLFCLKGSAAPSAFRWEADAPVRTCPIATPPLGSRTEADVAVAHGIPKDRRHGLG